VEEGPIKPVGARSNKVPRDAREAGRQATEDARIKMMPEQSEKLEEQHA